MNQIAVCPRDELATNDRMTVSVNEREIVIIDVEGDVYAVSNTCLHDGGPLNQGSVHESLEREITDSGEPDREYFSERPTITCPWHGWEYYLESGEHIGDDDIVLPTYEVQVKGGHIYVLM